MTDRWRSRIDSMLEAHPRLLAVSVHNKLRADGFEGSYPTVVRAVRDIPWPKVPGGERGVGADPSTRVTKPSSTSATSGRGLPGWGGMCR